MPSGMNEILPIISTVKIINSILVRVSWSWTQFFQCSDHGRLPRLPEITSNTMTFAIQRCVDSICALPMRTQYQFCISDIARCKNRRYAQPSFAVVTYTFFSILKFLTYIKSQNGTWGQTDKTWCLQRFCILFSQPVFIGYNGNRYEVRWFLYIFSTW
jgi:hypothetical protein